MLNRIKAFFAPDAAHDAVPSLDDRTVAAASLLVEAARLDDNFASNERRTVLDLLSRRFGLERHEAETLLEMAEARQEQAGGLFGFTHTVKEGFSPSERLALVEMLWEVAYADGKLHDFEANLIRRVAGLLYVSDRERGEARKRVLEKLNLNEA